MVEKIQTLIQENYVNEILKKEAQLKAMESQMDPHFLYNTLESINWRAKMIKSEEISQITTALGSLLRFSLGKNSEDFTLDQEMQIVNNYITIQKIRYQRRLDFSADVPSDLLGVFHTQIHHSASAGKRHTVRPGRILRNLLYFHCLQGSPGAADHPDHQYRIFL